MKLNPLATGSYFYEVPYFEKAVDMQKHESKHKMLQYYATYMYACGLKVFNFYFHNIIEVVNSVV